MKYLRYIWYVFKHKYYVGIECFRRELYWQGITHDLSKFLPFEFFPYVEFFYGPHSWQRGAKKRPPKHIDDAFDRSWLHHQHWNKHHWQHWIRHGDDGGVRVFEMPLKYRIEMLCDWIGAGKAQGSTTGPAEWFKTKSANMMLGVETLLWIERELEVRLYSCDPCLCGTCHKDDDKCAQAHCRQCSERDAPVEPILECRSYSKSYNA